MKSLYSFLSRVESASNVKLSASIATNPTENLLKKFFLRTAGVVALLLVFGGSVMGQCTSYRTNVACTTAAPTTLNSSISCTPPSNNGGRRNFDVTNMVAGYKYRVSNCASGFDTQLTIFNTSGTVVAYNDDNGPGCTGSAASIDFVPSASGTYWIQLNRYNCATANVASGSITVTLIAIPTISSTGSLTAFSSCSGLVSPSQSFSVSGANMVAGITVTPPVGFEVSTSSTFATNVGTNASPIIVGAAGTIASNTIYVRLSSTATGTPSGNIALTSTSATTQNVAVSGTVNSTSNPAGTINNDAASCGNVTLNYSSPSANIYWQTSASGTSTASPTTASYSLASSGTIHARAYNSTTGCWSTETVNSGAITVVPTAPATVSIAASLTGTVCSGATVTFTPTASTPANSNSYIWYVNSQQVGTSSTFSTNTLVNGDQVSCQLTTTSPCATVPTASSNTLTMSVSSFPTTQASIGAYTNNNSGTGITVNWTRGDGSTGVIVVARATATVAVEPASGTTYTANATFGSGTGSATTGTGNFVVYVGTGTSVAVTGLSMNTSYTYTVYEYSSSCYLTPGSSSSVTTPVSNALSFDGTDDRVNCGQSASINITGNAITLEAWIYPTAWKTSSWQGNIINRELGAFGGYMLRCGATGTLSFNFGNGTAWFEVLSSTNALTLNTWQHVAGTYDGTTLRIYVNGTQVGSSTQTATIAAATGQNLTIGNWSQDNTRGFQGYIDETRIWSVAKTAAELTSGMTQTPDPCAAGLRSSYSFNQGVANGTNTGVTTLTDATANANNGTLTNMSLTGTSSNWVPGKSGISPASVADCSGTPSPGNTTASSTSVTSGTVVTLGLQNSTCGSGVTYQWQSSTTSSTAGFSDISGATSSTYAPAVTASTWFRCNVTCSGNTATSLAVQVVLTYCVASSSSQSSWISAFSTSGGITNISYSSATAVTGTGGYQNLMSSNTVTSSVGAPSINLSMTAGGPTCGFAVWVDWNDNLTFESGERMFVTSGYVTSITGSFSVPVGTINGSKRMRVVTDYNSTAPSSACGNISRGEYIDFTFNVVVPSISASGSLSAFTTCSGSVSTSQNFTVSGTNLGASLVVNAINGFEVSTSQNGTYSTSVSYTPVSGTVSSQTVWVRLTSTATGNPFGNIAVSSTGGTTQNIAVSGTVNATPTSVTVTGGAICGGATITAAGGTGGTIYWQGTSSNGTSTSIGSGATSPAISSAGTYYARSQSAEGCWGAEGSASVTITPIPSCIGAGFAPANASSSVNPVVGATITWSAVADATSYDVYFGTDNTPTNMANGVNQIGLSYETGELTEATTYYWMIVPKNSCGAASNCSVYSFTTTSACTAPTISSTSNVNINCFNGSTGSITVNATGGVSGYEYSKDNGTTWQESNVFGSLAAGSYTIVVKGGDACVGAPSIVTLTQPAAALSVSASGSGSGCGGSTLTLSSTVAGGTSPYTYLWSNSGGLNDATLASPTATIGSYASHTLTVTDNNGCTATSSTVTITNNSPAAPTVTTPAAICQGQSANLNATSSGNSINWYTQSAGGTPIASLVTSGANYSVSPVTTTTYYGEAVIATPGSQSFSYTGSIVNWTVPAGVTKISVDARGAQGGSQPGTDANYGGRGVRIVANEISVTPGQVLKILVGQAGTNGSSDDGCGGGGGTFLTTSSDTPIVIAGGGGGDGADQPGINASTSTTSTANGDASRAGSAGPDGGLANDGSGGGGLIGNGANGASTTSGGRSFINGGAGGVGLRNGGFGGGGAGGTTTEGAGGGGGYAGGPGGASGTDAGGGGSSYSIVAPLTSTATQTGNGSLLITYTVLGCASSRTPVTITVNEAPTANAGNALSAICQGQTSAVMGGSIGGTATSGIWSGGAGTWTNATDPANATYTAGASESGTITLTLTPNGGSCPAVAASKTIVVNSNPSAPSSPVNLTICQGGAGNVSITSPTLTSSQSVAFNIATEPTETNLAPGNQISTATISALPNGSTITSAALTVNNLTALSSSWMADVRLGLSGAVTYSAVAGSSNNSAGAFNYTSTVSSGISVNTASTTLNLLYWDNVSDNAGVECTFGAPKTASLVLNYNYPATINWYSAATGGTLLGTGASFNPVGSSVLPNTNTPGTYNFYAAAVNTNGCESSRVLVTVTITATPNAGAITGTQTICSNETTTFITDGNSGGSWTSGTLGVATVNVSSGAITPVTAGTSIITYTVIGTGGCSNATATRTVTVNAVPNAPAITVVDNCNGTSTLSTTATGTLAWSNSETTSPITVSTAGTYTVIQTVNGCTSAAGSGIAAPKSTPETPLVSVVNDCGQSTLSFTPAANATILWSNNATTSSTSTANTETITVVQTVSGCPSSSGSGSAVPLVIPSAPTATASQNFCVTDNATVGSLAYTSVVGNTYTWYDAATAGNTVATSTQLPTATTTYYLATTGTNGCTSTSRTAVAATESAQALATVSITGTTVCAGGEIVFTATPVNGGLSPTYQWYNGGVPIQNETGNTYIATGLAEGAVITVKMIPSGSCVTVCPN